MCVQLLRGICKGLLPPRAGLVSGGPSPALREKPCLWTCPGPTRRSVFGSLGPPIPAPSYQHPARGTPCGDPLAGQRGLLINSRAEATICSVDASAEEVGSNNCRTMALSAAAIICGAMALCAAPSPSSSGNSAGAFPRGAEWGLSSLRRAGTLSKSRKGRLSLPGGPCHLRAGGVSEGPWLRARSWGHFGWVCSLSAIRWMPRGKRRILC